MAVPGHHVAVRNDRRQDTLPQLRVPPEICRDLPQPHFVSGGLREGPIGGGAMGMAGMGGMGGGMGMQSVRPAGH